MLNSSKFLKRVSCFFLCYSILFLVFFLINTNVLFGCNNKEKSLLYCGTYHLKEFPAGTTTWPSMALSNFCKESGAIIDGVGPKHCSTPSPECGYNPARFTRNISGHIYPPFPAYPTSNPWFHAGRTGWFCNRPGSSGWVYCRASLSDQPKLLRSCGTHHEKSYPYNQLTWPNGTFCAEGEISPIVIPSYPGFGQRTTWECVIEGTPPVSCWTERDPCIGDDCPIYPECGDYNGMTLDFRITSWSDTTLPGLAYDNFCSPGAFANLSGDPYATDLPESDYPFPPMGGTTSWQCLGKAGLGELTVPDPVTCRAHRDPSPYSSWVSTRGGLVHIESNIKMRVLSNSYSELNLSLLKFAELEETSLSTALLTSKEPISDTNLGWLKQIYRLPDYTKRINNPWYDTLLSRAESRDPNRNYWSFLDEENPLNPNLCKDNQHIYFIPGDLSVDPEVYKDFGTSENINGCIFVVNGNVMIDVSNINPAEGSHYGVVRGFFLSDGSISVGDENSVDMDYGLKILGSLFATGGPSSILVYMDMGLKNEDQPSLIISHDARYLNLARKVFSGVGYIKDVGLKE